MKVTFQALDSGEWGLRIEAQQSAIFECIEGETVIAKRKDGKEVALRVGKFVRRVVHKYAKSKRPVEPPTALFDIAREVKPRTLDRFGSNGTDLDISRSSL